MWINRALWVIYIALLAVLLPHTSWAFRQFEPKGWAWVGWVAAFAFEAAIAAFTWRLKQLIETTPNYRAGIVWLRRFKYRYFSPYGLGLFAALIISAVANWAHAVEFGQEFAVFARYSVPTWAFSVGFGAILPLISLLFARVLAEAQDTEEETNQDLVEAKQTIKELRKQLKNTEDARTLAEERFGAMGDLVHYLFAEEKRLRILAIKQLWPQLPGKTIANMTEASQSYVSEVLTSGEIIMKDQD
jgi:hypothetical protein